MSNHYEIVISAADAEALALMLGQRRIRNSSEADAESELTDLLMEARLLPRGQAPSDHVSMNSRVTYVQEADGVERTVVLAFPEDARPADGYISVLSPVGLALLGRAPGSVVDVPLDGRAPLRIRILKVAKPMETAVRQEQAA